ncbi:YqcC family protein [Suttonella sp. R2A3]|uniref:YqcC family protein n=1 Tax=Suttonella sp. R2A3 TaxID=2908648 RepID=UPI001F3E244C|nr:YqcC family protein [Suttonella sp. R2A3]UJF24491.1 YqcC family protein [Suttonella sp. R2A3]
MSESRHEQMQQLLILLEAQLRHLDWWQDTPPSAQALASKEAFCVDTLCFSEWLQWLYIPRMRSLVLMEEALPTQSGLLPMAEEAWRGCTENTEALLQLIAQLDQTINR